jgi:hypothetical protein
MRMPFRMGMTFCACSVQAGSLATLAQLLLQVLKSDQQVTLDTSVVNNLLQVFELKASVLLLGSIGACAGLACHVEQVHASERQFRAFGACLCAYLGMLLGQTFF